MIRKAFALTGIGFSLFFPLLAAAQVEDEALPRAVITGPSEVGVGRTIILDASASRTASGTVAYSWYLDDSAQSISRSVEALFTPEEPGEYVIRLVISQVIDGITRESEELRTITAFTRKIVVIADQSIPEEKLAVHQETAHAQGAFLQVLKPPVSAIPLGIEESLVQLLGDQFGVLSNADAVVLWTNDPVAGVQALMRASRGDEQRLLTLRNLSLIVISDGSLRTLGRAVRGPFSVMKPARLLLTRKESFNPILEAADISALPETLQARDIDAVILDASSLSIRPWNVFSLLVNFMLTHGISSQTVILLLMLPVIATILAFLKQVIGVTTFGLYTPSIIALSFLALGWPIGLVFLSFILFGSYVSRRAMRRWRILYIPKIAIILTVVSIILLLALALGAAFGIALAPDTIFVLLIMSTLSESFLTLEGTEGMRSAFYGIVETVLAALLCVFIVRLPMMQSFILAYPETILLTLPLNFILGRYSGLRLMEYVRFREVFSHLQE